jgi:hypothetical protein
VCVYFRDKPARTWRDAAWEGRYTGEFLEQLEKEREARSQVFKMEYEAEFAEEVDTWLTQDLLDELNAERYELTKTGRIAFSHPEGTHDDRFWALALAVYAVEKTGPTPSKPIARST